CGLACNNIWDNTIRSETGYGSGSRETCSKRSELASLSCDPPLSSTNAHTLVHGSTRGTDVPDTHARRARLRSISWMNLGMLSEVSRLRLRFSRSRTRKSCPKSHDFGYDSAAAELV